MSEAEVARSLGVTAGTVKTHLHRGVATLRAALRHEDERETEAYLAGN
jgi:DNA-directed RNA polymerase specialized sigma24 family protein